MTYPPPHKGFIALISALIISTVMLLIATGGSIAGFYTRGNALMSEYKERSYALAEACASKTLITLATAPSYGGNATTTVSNAPDGTCYTSTISKTGVAPNDSYQFKVRSIYQNSYTVISVTAKVSDLSVTKFTEVPMY